MPKKKEKKVLVSSSFLSDFDKLQKKVGHMDVLEKELEIAKQKADENDALQKTLTNFQSEYEQMKAQNKLEIERRIKATKKIEGIREKLTAAERLNSNHKINTKRLKQQKRDVTKSYQHAKKKVDILSIDIVKKDDDLKRQVEIQKELGKLMKRRDKELERERQERLKDMHTKEIQTRTVERAILEKDRLARRIGMQDSIANQHTHESFVLVEALRCSKRVSEVYSEDLNAREEELQMLKEKLARVELVHKDALQTIEDEQYRRKDLERQHRRLQSYMMATAKSKSEIMGIMDPSSSRLIESTIHHQRSSSMMQQRGMQNMMLENPELNEFHDQMNDEEHGGMDDGIMQQLVIRRDVEPPLYQAPTFSHLVRSQEQLKIVQRPSINIMGGSSTMSKFGGSKLPTNSRVGGPIASNEPLGFGTAGSRFLKTPRLDQVSEDTLRIVQPPPRMIRMGGSMADTSAVGRPLLAPRVGPETGGAMDSFNVPWFQDAADGITQRTPGMLKSSLSMPMVGGGSSVLRGKDGRLKKSKRYKRRDGNSVTSSNGSLFLGHGLGLKKPKVERTMKGSARQILDNIVARIDHSKLNDYSLADLD
jgi:hypothetical protein